MTDFHESRHDNWDGEDRRQHRDPEHNGVSNSMLLSTLGMCLPLLAL